MFSYEYVVSDRQYVIYNTQNAQILQIHDGSNICVTIEIMCSLAYHISDFVATHAFGHMIYRYTSLVSKKPIVLNNLNLEPKISRYKGSTT